MRVIALLGILLVEHAGAGELTPAERKAVIARAETACAAAGGQNTGVGQACATRRMIAAAVRSGRTDLDEALVGVSETIANDELAPRESIKQLCRARQKQPPPRGSKGLKTHKELLESCDLINQAEALVAEYSTESPLSVEYYNNSAAIWVGVSATLKLESVLRALGN